MNDFIFISGLLDRNIVMNAIRGFVAFIDSIILSLISSVYNMIFAIANFSGNSQLVGLYNKIEDRVYVIVGIFILFKVLMSLISYLASPDKLTDKEQGAGKFIVRVITSLILLIAVPQIVFPTLDRLQEPLVATVAKVIMGNEINTSNADVGVDMTLSMFSTFFTNNKDCDSSGAVNSTLESIFELPNLATEACPSNKSLYRYDYFMLISSTFYLIVVVLLLIIGIDLAIRSFKLIVLKVLAPIPILSYISPKSAKDGIFSSYVKLFATTWLDIFIKFGVIYLGFAFIQLIVNEQLVVDVTSSLISTGLGSIFLILGAIIFMFQAPKFIKKALNLKDAEFGTGVAGILGIGATTAGMVGAGAASYRGSKEFVDENGNRHTTFQNVAAGLAGALGGGVAGAKVAMGKDASVGKVFDAINKHNAESYRNRSIGLTAGDKASNWFGTTFLGQSPFDRMKNEVDGYDQLSKDYQSYIANEKKEATKGKYAAVTANNLGYGYGSLTGKSKEFTGAAEKAKAMGLGQFTFDGKTIDMSHVGYLTGELEKAEQAAFRRGIVSGNAAYTDGNADLVAGYSHLQDEYQSSGVANITDSRTHQAVGNMKADFKGLDDQMKQVSARSSEIKNSKEYKVASASAKK